MGTSKLKRSVWGYDQKYLRVEVIDQNSNTPIGWSVFEENPDYSPASKDAHTSWGRSAMVMLWSFGIAALALAAAFAVG